MPCIVQVCTLSTVHYVHCTSDLLVALFQSQPTRESTTESFLYARRRRAPDQQVPSQVPTYTINPLCNELNFP